MKSEKGSSLQPQKHLNCSILHSLFSTLKVLCKGHRKSFAFEPFQLFPSKLGRFMHFSLPPPHSSTSLCPRNPHPVFWTGMSERRSSLLSWFIGLQCLLSGTEVPEVFRPALSRSREVTAIMLQQNAGKCSALSRLGDQSWGE